MNDVAPKTANFRCSFYKKTQDQVLKMISGQDAEDHVRRDALDRSPAEDGVASVAALDDGSLA
jgi:hypothetical protein